MARLADERVKLDSMRREMELSMGKEYAVFAEGMPRTPEYTSSTPVGEEDDAQRVRGAVLSFNSKMLEKYGDDDENIPTSEPTTPRSPAYSSIFDGGGHRIAQSGGGKFIPQIPTTVLDSYLNSRYGVSGAIAGPASSVAASLSGPGIMTGGSGLGFPTMNIPVVATMPMTGMMPVQQQTGGGNPLQPQQQWTQPGQQSGQNTAGQSGAQVGGGASAGNEPNPQGVRTFSIKL